MNDASESQGIPVEGKPDVAEKLAEMKQESQTLAERAKTVSERLEKITSTKVETPEPVPSSNQTQIPEVQAEPSQEAKPTALPDSVSERTREQFEKLRDENRRLKEERKREAGTSVFDSLRGPAQTVPPIDLSQFSAVAPQQAQTIKNTFVAPDGTVDIDGLNNALRQANDRALIAESQARGAVQSVQQIDERQQVREAHLEHPELDPESQNFDPNFYDLVALRLVKSGMKMTLTQAAVDVKKSYSSPTVAPVNLDKVRDEAINSYKESLARRNQEPLSSAQGEPRTAEPINVLREKTRRGDPFALDERLRKIGLIK